MFKNNKKKKKKPERRLLLAFQNELSYQDLELLVLLSLKRLVILD